MKRSIVPRGFEVTAHPIFFEFDMAREDPTLPNVSSTNSSDITTCLSPSLDKTPTVVTKANIVPHCHDVDDMTCPICLSRFINPVTVVSCYHAFCYSCLMKWYRVRVACPLCKCPGNYFLENDLAATPPVKLWTVVQDRVLDKPHVEEAIRCHLKRFAPIHGLAMKQRGEVPKQRDESDAIDQSLQEALELLQQIDQHAKRRK